MFANFFPSHRQLPTAISPILTYPIESCKLQRRSTNSTFCNIHHSNLNLPANLVCSDDDAPAVSMMESQDLLRLIDRRAAEDRWKELDLAGMNLTELPAEIVKLSQLEKLILGKWDENTGDLQAILSFYFQLDIY